MSPRPSPCSRCDSCPRKPAPQLPANGDDLLVALAGNPNTGKSTVFNRLTGLHQHTGNWPGKTIARAEGGFTHAGRSFHLVDLPGTYSLLSASPDEEVARDFLLFGKPDITLVVADATSLERNLNLLLQILQTTDRVVLCLNLMDEARAHRITIDVAGLSTALGIPVIPCSARSGEGFDALLAALLAAAHTPPRAFRPPWPEELGGSRDIIDELNAALLAALPDLPHPEWVALRLLEGDASLRAALLSGDLGKLREDHAATASSVDSAPSASPELGHALLQQVEALQWRLPPNFHDLLTEQIYAESARIYAAHVRREPGSPRQRQQLRADRWLTHPLVGFPLMFILFVAVLWMTIEGANVPSKWLGTLLLDRLHPLLRSGMLSLGAPEMLVGILVDGMYLSCAWVVSVMLPPMAIFFPLFTFLEDLGYLPRVAFNLDPLFQKVGAHGKQALTLSMGLGCNAAGVIACRIIDSPRERLIAIITNNFSLCNGRWPTQILLATLFFGALAPPALGGVLSALTVALVAIFGFFLTFLTSWALNRSVLRGEASSFSLELPPYRPPNILRILHSSLIDRTLFVLWRAVIYAAPAGAVIWVLANFRIADAPLAAHIVTFLDPFGQVMGLSGIILLAYIVAIPANEIVLPTILMLTVLLLPGAHSGAGAGVLFEPDSSVIHDLLIGSGWTTLTALSLMLFSLCHNPCSTTIHTIYKETGSARWTLLATLIPLAYGFTFCILLTFLWRAFPLILQ